MKTLKNNIVEALVKGNVKNVNNAKYTLYKHTNFENTYAVLLTSNQELDTIDNLHIYKQSDINDWKNELKRSEEILVFPSEDESPGATHGKPMLNGWCKRNKEEYDDYIKKWFEKTNKVISLNMLTLDYWKKNNWDIE